MTTISKTQALSIFKAHEGKGYNIEITYKNPEGLVIYGLDNFGPCWCLRGSFEGRLDTLTVWATKVSSPFTNGPFPRLVTTKLKGKIDKATQDT